MTMRVEPNKNESSSSPIDDFVIEDQTASLNRTMFMSIAVMVILITLLAALTYAVMVRQRIIRSATEANTALGYQIVNEAEAHYMDFLMEAEMLGAEALETHQQMAALEVFVAEQIAEEQFVRVRMLVGQGHYIALSTIPDEIGQWQSKPESSDDLDHIIVEEVILTDGESRRITIVRTFVYVYYQDKRNARQTIVMDVTRDVGKEVQSINRISIGFGGLILAMMAFTAYRWKSLLSNA